MVDAHVFQVPDAPALAVDVDRTLATEVGLTQQQAAGNMLVTTSSSAQTAPNFWVDPSNGVSYPLVVQQPTYDIDSSQDLKIMPVSGAGATGQSQLLMNLSSIGRRTVPMVTSQLNIRPVFDVQANVQGRDLYSASRAIDRVIAANQPPAEKAMHVELSGQVETMRESYAGLFAGIALAVVLVYLFLVINFQSWIDPLIVLLAVPFALGGVIWMLFLTQTHLSVPALMGTLMCDRAHDRQQHPGRDLRQSAHGGRGRAAHRGGNRRLHPAAPGADDRRGDDSRHGADGDRRRRRRRAERAARARGHRRTPVRDLRDAGVCADNVPAAAARAARAGRRLKGTGMAGRGRGSRDRLCRGDHRERSARGLRPVRPRHGRAAQEGGAHQRRGPRLGFHRGER